MRWKNVFHAICLIPPPFFWSDSCPLILSVCVARPLLKTRDIPPPILIVTVSCRVTTLLIPTLLIPVPLKSSSLIPSSVVRVYWSVDISVSSSSSTTAGIIKILLSTSFLPPIALVLIAIFTHMTFLPTSIT